MLTVLAFCSVQSENGQRHEASSPHYRAGVMQTLTFEEFIASCKIRIVFR